MITPRLFDELVEMFKSEMKSDERKAQIADLIEPLVTQIISIFKEQLGHYLQVFGISFLILLVVSLVNLSLLLQKSSVKPIST